MVRPTGPGMYAVQPVFQKWELIAEMKCPAPKSAYNIDILLD
jgi:hypothetical protein